MTALPILPDDPDHRIPFLLVLAESLHDAGYATYSIEEALGAMAARLQLFGQYFVTPTSIFVSFGHPPSQQTFMIRTEPRWPDLGKLAAVTATARAVIHDQITPAEGIARLLDFRRSKVPPGLILLAAHGLAAGSAARFLGGGWPEIRMAALAGVMTGLFALVAVRFPGLRRIYELSAAFLASVTMALLAASLGDFSLSIATLAGLIVLVPGLTVTTAIAELAMSHLTAGTTRMAGAFMTFIGIGFGVALGQQIAAVLLGAAPVVAPAAMSPLFTWVALLGSAVAFSVLLRARWQDLGWIVLAGALAFLGTRLGSALVGAELGAFIGALAVGLGSNLFNRITGRPASITLVPGLLILVPGSIGFRSIFALLDSQVVAGIDTAFTMMLTAVSLVAGLLTASAVFPEKPIV